MIPQPFRFGGGFKENADTFTLEIESTDGQSLCLFTRAVQHALRLRRRRSANLDLRLFGGPQTIAHTTRAVGTVTRAMAKLKRGELLGVRGPFGSAWPTEAALERDVVLIAGGIGLAPLRPVLHRLLVRRRKAARVVLLCGARTPDCSTLASWNAGEKKCEVHVTVDRATGAWRGNIGVVTTDPADAVRSADGHRDDLRPRDHDAIHVRELQKRGVSENRIFLSLERNMKCATGFCGHCQFGPEFICKDGPVFRYDRVKSWLEINEL